MSKAGYWTQAATAFAKKIGLMYVEVEEDWGTRTVIITANKSDGAVIAVFDEQILVEMQRVFGTTKFRVEAAPDARYAHDPDYDNAVGAYLRIRILNVVLPQAPV